MRPTSGILFVLVLYCSIRVNADETSMKILGGEYAESNQFPYQVALLFHRRLRCGGSIISPAWVLTAAHCVARSGNKLDGFTILAGTTLINGNNGMVRDVENAIVHEKYIQKDPFYDVALLRLDKDLSFGASISAIEMMTDEVPIGADVVISGWGVYFRGGPASNRLKFNTLYAVNWSECVSPSGISHYGIMCLGHSPNNGACFGDSGGSATYRGKLAGIAAFVVGSCGTHNPDGYSKVSYYVDWVKRKVGKL